MAIDKREVELIIKANNLSSKQLKEVTDAVDKLSESIDSQVSSAKKGETSLSALNKSYSKLEEAGKALVGQQALIDRFQQVADSLDVARVKATGMRAAYQALAEEQAKQGTATKSQEAQLAKLAKSADAADRALERQQKTLSDLAEELNRAGVSTDKLDAAQSKLIGSANQVAAGLHKIGQAQDSITKNPPKLDTNPFADNGRTTLSLLQRIRGEVLALTAAYVGLQGVISGVASVLDAAKTEQQVQSKLLAVTGNDAKAAGEEYNYLVGQAERLGAFLPDLAKTYTSFAIAAKAANMNTKEMRFVFERVAEAGKVMHLNDDDMKGIFNAITQMVSKGKIQSEELRGQLGDRLPGAIVFAAKKYEGGVKEFVKQLEKGNIEATNGVINLARGLDEAFNKQLAGATQSVESQENRFKNAVYEFKKSIADSGLTQAYTDLIVRLTEFIRSDEGKKFAEDLANAFKKVAEALIFVVDNFQTFASIAELIVGLYLAKQFFNMAVAITDGYKAIMLLNKGLSDSPKLVTGLQKAFLLLQSFMVGWEIGTVLSDKFEVVRQLGVALVIGFEKLFTRISYAGQIAWAAIATSWEDASASIFNAFNYLFKSILLLLQKAATAAGQKGLADNIGKLIEGITAKHTEAAQSKIDQLKAQMKKDLDEIDRIGFEMFQDASDASRKARAELAKQRTAGPDGKPTTDPGGNAAAYATSAQEAKNAVAKYRELLAEIEAIEAQGMKKQKDSIDTVIAGIEKQYDALFRKIKDSGLKSVSELSTTLKTEKLDENFAELIKNLNEQGIKGAADLQTRLRAAVDVLKSEAVERYAKEQMDKVQAIQKAFAEIENKIGKGRDATLQERFTAIDDSYASVYAKINDLDEQHKGNLKEQLDVLIEQTKAVEQQKFAYEKVAASQKQLNEAVSARDDRIKTTNDLVQNSIITEAEGRERIKQIIADSQPGIDEYAKTTREVVESLKDILDPAVYDAAIAKIDLAAASANRFKVELYSARQANQDLAAGITGALDKSAEGFGKAIVGAESLSDAIHGAGRAFLDFAAQFLRKIAEMILQQIILNALQKSNTGGNIASVVAAAVAHEGGVVGSTVGRSRSVDTSWFSNAPKYHTGGLVGMAADEYPAILKKNEEVLTTNDPRNIINGGGKGGQSAQPVVQDVKVVNTIDSGSFVSEGLSTPAGTKAIFNFIRANKSQLNALLG